MEQKLLENMSDLDSSGEDTDEELEEIVCNSKAGRESEDQEFVSRPREKIELPKFFQICHKMTSMYPLFWGKPLNEPGGTIRSKSHHSLLNSEKENARQKFLSWLLAERRLQDVLGLLYSGLVFSSMTIFLGKGLVWFVERNFEEVFSYVLFGATSLFNFLAFNVFFRLKETRGVFFGLLSHNKGHSWRYLLCWSLATTSLSLIGVFETWWFLEKENYREKLFGRSIISHIFAYWVTYCVMYSYYSMSCMFAFLFLLADKYIQSHIDNIKRNPTSNPAPQPNSRGPSPLKSDSTFSGVPDSICEPSLARSSPSKMLTVSPNTHGSKLSQRFSPILFSPNIVDPSMLDIYAKLLDLVRALSCSLSFFFAASLCLSMAQIFVVIFNLAFSYSRHFEASAEPSEPSLSSPLSTIHSLLMTFNICLLLIPSFHVSLSLSTLHEEVDKQTQHNFFFQQKVRNYWRSFKKKIHQNHFTSFLGLSFMGRTVSLSFLSNIYYPIVIVALIYAHSCFF